MRHIMRRPLAGFIATCTLILFSDIALAASAASTDTQLTPSALNEMKFAKKPAAPKPDPKKVKSREKTIEGIVMFLKPNRISIEVAESADGGEDMFIPLDKKVKISRAKKMSDIKQGDKVSVKYRQTFLEPETKGAEPVILSTAGVEITLLKKAEIAVKSKVITALEEEASPHV